MQNESIDKVKLMELKKVEMNRLLFSISKSDHFTIDKALEILNLDKIPVDIPMNNNMIFIRDLTMFIVKNDLKPNIGE